MLESIARFDIAFLTRAAGTLLSDLYSAVRSGLKLQASEAGIVSFLLLNL